MGQFLCTPRTQPMGERMTQEQKARVGIDTLLKQTGWHVCSRADVNIHASLVWRYANTHSKRPPVAFQTTVTEVGFGLSLALWGEVK